MTMSHTCLLRVICGLAIGALCATTSCRDKKPIAELTEGTGVVEHNRKTSSWKSAKVGAKYHYNDAVRTQKSSSARLRLVGGTGLALAEATTVRFGTGSRPGATYSVEVEAGEAYLEGAPGGSSLELDIGLARLTGNTRIKLTPKDGRMEFQVLVGDVRLTNESGSLDLKTGQIVELRIGEPLDKRVIEPDAGVAIDASVPDAAPPEVEGIAATVTGKVTLDDGTRAGRRLEKGEQVIPNGARLRLARRAKLQLRRGDSLAFVRGPATIRLTPNERDLLAVDGGTATIHAKSADLNIKVPGGGIAAKKHGGVGSKAVISVARGATSVAPKSGTIVVVGSKGATETIGIGEKISLRRTGTIEVRGRSPGYSDFTVSAGESATIHDPKPPTAVRIKFAGKCPGPGVVELSSRRNFARSTLTRGEGSAVVRFSGSRYYRVRCIVDGALNKRIASKGRLSVRRDSGTRPIPRTPPTNTLKANGLSYTVLYQNLLPVLTIRWPGAVGASSYELNVKSAAGTLVSYTTSQPSHTIGSGQLQEGRYTYWFETNTGTSSKLSSLKIEFDNASPMAHLSSPKPQAGFGSVASIRGAALKGWSVSINGRRLKLDSHSRFEATGKPKGGDRAVGIRFSHRKRGVHYYLRRSGRQ